ncbi:MAG: cadherin domain-containing protein, partial [Proteobacteria bacterium]|nr:cadherin domain-containing protein [Pseudomonadota bacterium]
TVVYSIVGGADQAQFSIDPATGALSFIGSPDFETPIDINGDNIYEVTVRADDQNGLTTDQTINVTVTDVNDNSPLFTSGTSFNVAENTSVVGTITATDADLPAQTVVYSIVGGADQAQFSIDPATGALSFIGAPDFDLPIDSNGDNIYEVTVRADDQNGLTTDQTINVTVTDVNDNAPSFTTGPAFNVAENTSAVGTVTATDADLPAQTVVYSIAGGADQAQFSIDANSGALSFIGAPDFENPIDINGDNIYEVTVRADDQNGLTTNQTINVTVTNVNDNAPSFTTGPAFNVVENTSAVGTVTATDADLPAQTVVYSLAGGADQAQFSIDANSGALSFIGSPDFETPVDINGDNIYEVTVRADDQNGLTSDQTINVTVTDVDDLYPTISSVTMTDTDLKIGETSEVTITFSEAVTNFDNSDVTVENGTVDAFVTTDGGTTWKATFTPDADIYDTSNLVTVADTYTDLAGNAGTGGTSANYVIDTKAPVFDVELYTSPSLKVTTPVPHDPPAGSYVVGATNAEHDQASSPAGQATREIISGTNGDDFIDHNPAFSADPLKWVKTLHFTFSNFTLLTSIVIVIADDISAIAGFDIEGVGVVRTGNSWEITPTAAMLVDGLDLNVVYDFSDTGGPVEFSADVTVEGDAGAIPFIVNNSMDFSWRDATTEADFTLPLGPSGNPVMVLPRDGLGVDILAGDGNDTVNAGAGHDTIYGGTGNDIIHGGAGDDTIYGEADDDTLYGDAGNDTLVGGTGTNTLYGDVGDDIFIGGAGTDAFYGGDDLDTVSYAGDNTGVTVSLAANTGAGGDAQGDTYYDIENLIGGSMADSLTGADNDNTFYGGSGGDTLDGGLGTNTLYGDTGNDLFIGGAGTDAFYGGDDLDTVSYAADNTGVTVSLAANTGVGGDAQGDKYYDIENLIGGSMADSLTGNDQDNVLDGGAGSDTLDGGLGTNILNGETGDDIFIGGAGTDSFYGGDDLDTVSYAADNTGVTVSLAANTGAGGDAQGDKYYDIENLIGGSMADSLTGADNDNTFYGGSGGDTLDGGLGTNTLYGEIGNDIFIGGAGTDSFYGGDDLDTVSYAADNAGVTVSLAANTGAGGDAQGDKYYDIENLIGGSMADSLTGNDQNNILDGGAGDDLLIGGIGADQLHGGSNTILGDTASYAGDIAGVIVSLDGPADVGIGGHAQGDTFDDIENLIGGDGSDQLIGSSGHNHLSGGLGDDVLMGGGGADILGGGANNAGGDTASYANASGPTGVWASLNDSLWDIQDLFPGDAVGDRFYNIENLTGSDYNDTLYGDSFDNIINGGGGNDLMYGGAGADTIYADQGNDTAKGDINNDIFHVSADLANLPTSIDGEGDNGGTGDVMVLHDLAAWGAGYDLTDLASVTHNIETLDISGDLHSTELTINSQDILNMVGDGNSSELTILADSGDSFVLDSGAQNVPFVLDLTADYTITDGGQTAVIHWVV